MTTYLVTGGAGFIGSNLVDHLLATYPGCQVRVLDKLTYAGNPANLEAALATGRCTLVKGDVCSGKDAAAACEGADYVIHAAAESHVDRSILAGQDAARTNFLGTFTMLEAAREARAGRFLFVSTDEVYGSKPRGVFSEGSPLTPRNPYSAAKAGADRMAHAFSITYGMDILITRPSNNYGPRQFPEKLVPLFVYKALRDEPLPVYGDGRQRRDWLHVADHCRAMDLILHQAEPGAIYNIPGGNERRNLQTIKVILDELGKPADLIRHVEDRPGHDPRYPLCGELIAALGWSPQIEWEQGLRQTIRWYVDNPGWVKASIKRGEAFHRKWYANR